MDWDHRPAYATVLGNALEGQQAEGGVNRDNNCVPTTGCDIARAYGGPDLDPQELTTLAYGATWHGGEDYAPMVAALESLWAQCPQVTYSSPADTLAGVDAEASQGHAVGCSFHCDGAGVIQLSETGIFHVCTLVAHVAGHVYVMNSERNNLVVLAERDFAAATSGGAGELMHFQRPLPQGTEPMMTIQEAEAVVYAIVAVGLGEGPGTSGIVAQIATYANPMVSGDAEAGLSTLIAQLLQDPAYLPNRVKSLETRLAAITGPPSTTGAKSP
jgi:hypothetical protein